MNKIFIVEDDEIIVKAIKASLENEFHVRSVLNFRAVKQEILEFDADLVLMDIGLPFYSGFYWTSELRKVSQIPIIFISSSSDDMNQITAMNQGADDFVTKPFSLEILSAKIKALLRRSYAFSGAEKLEFAGFLLTENSISTDKNLVISQSRQNTDEIHAVDSRYDAETSNRSRSTDRIEIELTTSENKILTLLFRANGEVVTKEKILQELWQTDEFIDTNTLNVKMTRLRKKLAEIGFDEHIMTKRGCGYALV
ncbi:response regulator transcription factor [Lactococcus protaetiae]|uniref:Response regulator transcription factor n=1 Tax=Lactococcus protaetiae TaxID=2592653 RepID=A0A514ZAV3_9LACT|nr:response regulator transcription factor [Lactococcus protaetiae]MCL2112888.1 response regulator transcription factor [Streptococcaceae bacterium]QDK71710.1 response regulator transcription factor [Lactococcus protaetiae]